VVERLGAVWDAFDEPDIVLAVDPGTTGYMCALSLQHTHAKMFRLGHDDCGGVMVPRLPRALLERDLALACVIERVRGRGGWSAHANFALGGAVMSMAALLNALGHRPAWVTPMEWKNALGIPRADKEKGETPKDASLAWYRMMFPSDPVPKTSKGKINHNALDSFLIGLYAIKSLGYPWQKDWKFIRVDAPGAKRTKSFD
jgi:hypothetical protein